MIKAIKVQALCEVLKIALRHVEEVMAYHDAIKNRLKQLEKPE